MRNMISINSLLNIQNSVLAVFTIAITSVFLLTIGNNVFAIEYSKNINNKYGIGFNYPEIINLHLINPSIEQLNKDIII